MEHDFWAERWRLGQIGFHLSEANPHLVAHAARLADGPTRVLVPLCGKSVDMMWLRAQGHEVIGVDFIEASALAFFGEHGLEPAASRLGRHPVLRAPGVTIVLDDVLTLDPAALGRFAAVYDRAALVAVPVESRPAYIEKLRSLVSDDGRVLLVSFDHDIGTGPPFSLPEAELHALSQGRFVWEKLADLDLLPSEPRFRERGATRVLEQVWLGRPVGPTA